MNRNRFALAAFAIGSLFASSSAFAGGEFGQWRAPDASGNVTSPAGDSSSYNPHVNSTAGSGQDTHTEGDAISARTGQQNAAETVQEITSSGQAAPKGTPGG